MTMRLRLAAALSCLALAAGSAAAEKPAVVLVTGDMASLHLLQPDAPFQIDGTFANQFLPSPTSMDAVIGAAFGSAIATGMIEEIIARDAQKQADLRLAPLQESLGKDGLQRLVRRAFSESLAEHGMRQQALAYFSEAKASPKLLSRLRAARSAERFLLVGNGKAAQGYVRLPLTINPYFDHFRLALDIELREGSHDRSRRLSKRDVLVFTTPLALAEGSDPLGELARDANARLQAELQEGVRIALAAALEEQALPYVGKDDRVGVITRKGLLEFQGALVSHAEGRALLWTRYEVLVSVPADEVVTGSALDAARDAAAAAATVPSEEIAAPEAAEGPGAH
ncbi:MAG: hypothetical protein K0M64_03345 [Rhizobium sp.]|nr:hypothetical protein [Rhizobium sp.]